ncbi:MAG: PAS domain-containing sensor histidine kinase, partial [Thermodesulfobacteriota bacterium]
PPERADPEVLAHQRQVLEGQALVRCLLDALPEGVLILNPERQIVLANRSMLALLGVADDRDLLGFRPGEAMFCVHSGDGSGGCGTSEFCRTCGAARAIMESHESGRGARECRITRFLDGMEIPIELLVWATQFNLEGYDFTLFASQDISHEKRRRSLERIFFHDLLNTAGGLKGFAELLKLEAEGELGNLARTVHGLSDQLISEIQAQRHLMAAESGDLQVNFTPLNTKDFLREVAERNRYRKEAEEKLIRLAEGTAAVELVSDATLLGRVLDNLVKNALEATRPGENVTLGGGLKEGGVEFWVHNPGAVPREVELQIFQRSFTTKGAGRGLGTYSVKLLTDRYLGGKVSFTTSPQEGTVFRVWQPLNLDKL